MVRADWDRGALVAWDRDRPDSGELVVRVGNVDREDGDGAPGGSGAPADDPDARDDRVGNEVQVVRKT